jgi:hypothetical protein
MYESNYPFCQDDSVLNGYWWNKTNHYYWVPVYPSIKSWFLPGFVDEPEVMSGDATYYAPGVMEATAEIRGLSLNGFKDGIAMMSPADIGSTVWIYVESYGWYGPLLVVDCAQHGDIYPLIYYGHEVAELGAKSAKQLGLVSPKGQTIKWKLENILVTKTNPSQLDLDKITVVDFRSWWIDNLVPGIYTDLYKTVYRSPCTWRIDNKWYTFCSYDTGSVPRNIK